MIRLALLALAICFAAQARAAPVGQWRQADTTYYGAWADGACVAVMATRRSLEIHGAQAGALSGGYVMQRSARYLRKAETCAFPGNPLGEPVWEQAHFWTVNVFPQGAEWRLNARDHMCRFQACADAQGVPDTFTTRLTARGPGRLYDSGGDAAVAELGLTYRDAATIAAAEAEAIAAADAIIAKVKAGRIEAVLAGAPANAVQKPEIARAQLRAYRSFLADVVDRRPMEVWMLDGFLDPTTNSRKDREVAIIWREIRLVDGRGGIETLVLARDAQGWKLTDLYF